MNIECTACGSTLNVPATAIGKRGRCPKCKAVMLLDVAPIETELFAPTRDEDDLVSAVSEGPSRYTYSPESTNRIVVFDPATHDLNKLIRAIVCTFLFMLALYVIIILIISLLR